ncbi:MAG: 2-C-methyl-D-erythritol 4-phosphate cytidylyltransferase [Pseudomonadota bacterium]|nr:2-C-methyl-D-erythritol 4-phosphate cytidylyltransferase [Pseudomonadota bacterium]
MNHSQSSQTLAYWIVVPAAGVGARMGADCPKQYLPLVGRTVIEHTLERLLALPNVSGILLVLGADDNYWNDLPLAQHNRIHRVEGGAERCDSVLNALEQLHEMASPDDWVLVHDAARPCVHVQNILELIEQVKTHPVGGILGVPVSDTLKHVNNSIIDSTVDRRSLWQAQTPQMFRLGLLRDCLRRGLADGKLITDESSALESYGYQPLIVQGRSDNIKITRPEDLATAAMLLQLQV